MVRYNVPMPFQRYAAAHELTPFTPSTENAEDQGFVSAQTSFELLAARTQDMINAHGQRLNFSTGYVENMTPNAFADFHDGAHVMGMHQALLTTIIEFALYVFTQAVQFPQIGDAAGEDSPAPAFGAAPGIFLLEKTLRGGTINAQTDKHRVPKDLHRHVAAHYLAIIMARFVWMHELSHCANGHVLLLKSMGIKAALNEVPDPAMLVGFKKAKLDPDATQRMLHALELDADECALRTICRIQIMDGEIIEGIAALDFPTRLEMCLLGAYLTTWLFDEYQRFADTLHDRTHPLPKDRLSNLVRFARAELGAALEGFDAFHEGVCARFNNLADQIPNMYRINPQAATYSRLRMDDALLARLEPLAFKPVEA